MDSSSSLEIQTPILKPAPEPLFCKFCGTPIPKGKPHFSYILSEWNEEAVAYCVNCRVCPSGHYLNYCYDLTIFGEELYVQNKFNCDVCYKTMGVEGRVLRCPECTFDVCGECEEAFYTFDEGRVWFV